MVHGSSPSKRKFKKVRLKNHHPQKAKSSILQDSRKLNIIPRMMGADTIPWHRNRCILKEWSSLSNTTKAVSKVR